MNELNISLLRNALIDFYSRYNPEKVDTIDTILEKYKGNEVNLINNLMDKYNISEYPFFTQYIQRQQQIVSPTRPQEPPLPIPPPSLATLSVGMQDISTSITNRLLNWGLNTTDDEQLNSQTELILASTDLKAQLISSKKDNYVLRKEIAELKMRSASHREIDFSSQKQEQQNRDRELRERVTVAENRCRNKHAQLLDSISLNHRLEAQLRYLAIRALSQSGSAATDSVFCVQTEEVSSLKHLIALLPETDQLHFHTSSLLVGEESESDLGREQLLVLLAALRQQVNTLQTSYTASRVEFMLEVAQRAVSEERLVDQQAFIDRLHGELTDVKKSLKQANVDCEAQQELVAELQAELAHYKVLATQAQSVTTVRAEEIFSLQREVRRLEEAYAEAGRARSNLSSICAERVRETERQCREHVLQMQEAVVREREAMLAQVARSMDLSAELKVAVEHETHLELLRLRDEMFLARRSDAHKDREIYFLQQQLVEAAKRIALHNVNSNVIGELQSKNTNEIKEIGEIVVGATEG